jgi:hypothetical protein
LKPSTRERSHVRQLYQKSSGVVAASTRMPE